MRTTTLALLLSSALVPAGGCAQPGRRDAPPSAAPTTPAWQSTLYRDHPLSGVIFSPSTGARVDRATLESEAARADFVLLGEQHDNPDHHRLQAELIASIARAGKKPAVLLEMIDEAQDAVVASYRSTSGAPASGLGAALGWDKSGWPAWSMYEPIAEVAFSAGLPLLSANLPRALVRAIAHEGANALPPEEASKLGLDRPLAPALEASLEEELRASHCGQLPEAMVAPMAVAQRARDGRMTLSLLDATKLGTPAVLIAGSGHVRVDRGVAFRLREQRPTARVVSLAMVEVDPAAPRPEDYATRFEAMRLPFDFVWFTPRARTDDPCASLR